MGKLTVEQPKPEDISETEYLKLVLGPITFRPRGEGNPGMYSETLTTPIALVTDPYEPLLVTAKETGLILNGRSPLNIQGRKKGVRYTHASFSAENVLSGDVDLSDEYASYVAACYPRMKDLRDVRRSYLDGLDPECAMAIYA